MLEWRSSAFFERALRRIGSSEVDDKDENEGSEPTIALKSAC
jgi:hypothetical protein